VADARLVTANAVSTTLGTVSYTAALGAAAVLLNSPLIGADFQGYGVITATAAVGYLASAAILRGSFAPPDLGPPAGAHPPAAVRAALVDVVRGMLAGLRHLIDRPVAGYAMLVQAGHRGLFGVLTLATLLLFSEEFRAGGVGRSLGGLALLLVAGIGGVLTGAAVTPAVTRRLPGWAWVSLTLGGTAIAVLAVGPLFVQALFVIPVFVLNVAAQSTKIIVDTALQHECADAFRGRVFSVNDTAFNLTFVAGLFLAAVTLPADGESVTAVIAVAAGYAVLAGWYAAVARRAVPAG
jgi:hypothetical protein